MTQIEFLNEWAIWTGIVIFWLGIAAPAVTSFFWRWWKSVWGWNIMILDFCLSGVLLREAIHQTFGINLTPKSIPWGYETDVLLSFVVIAIAWRTVVIYKTQRKGAEHTEKIQNGSHKDSSGSEPTRVE